MDTGTEIIASYGGTPVFDADGRVTLAVLTIRDITAKRRAGGDANRREQIPGDL